MAGKYFGIPFALSGDRTAIPDAAQPDGSVSFTQGFTLDYELGNTDPNYKAVPREETNALYYDITEAIGIVQKQGFADWTADAQPYAVNASVRHNDDNWFSVIPNNSDEPGVGPGATSWKALGGEPPASETVAGIIKLATQALTDALLDDLTAVTPEKLGNGVAFGVVGSGWYLALPSWLGGWIIQSQDTGSVALSSGQAFSVNFTYPIPFTTVVHTVNASTDNQSVVCSAAPVSLTQYSAGFQNLLASGASASNRIIAIGK